MYLSTFGCSGSSLLCIGFLELQQARLLSSRSASAPLVAEHRLEGARARSLQCTGLAAPWHVEFPQTRDQTRVPCIGRWIFIHCTTKELHLFFFNLYFKILWPRCTACVILVPCPRIKPASPALEAWSLNNWTAKEVPAS